jgi:hypothetical protein
MRHHVLQNMKKCALYISSRRRVWDVTICYKKNIYEKLHKSLKHILFFYLVSTNVFKFSSTTSWNYEKEEVNMSDYHLSINIQCYIKCHLFQFDNDNSSKIFLHTFINLRCHNLWNIIIKRYVLLYRLKTTEENKKPCLL